MTLLEAMKQAIDALEARCGTNADERKELIPSLHAAIEEMEKAKPVAYLYSGWQLLTPDEVEERNKEYDRNSQEHDEQVPLYTHPAPIPEGWLQAIDEALVVAHIGVANPSDTYEQAKAKLDTLIGLHVDIATDPAVNGGWQLVPIEPTDHMRTEGRETYRNDVRAAAEIRKEMK